MEKTLFCVVFIAVISGCSIATVLASPEITDIQGGYGIRATVVDADQYNWRIEIIGLRVFHGDCIEGIINGNGTVTIRTPFFRPALGVGFIDIRVTLFHHWFPVDMEKRSAIMVGPFLLVIQ